MRPVHFILVHGMCHGAWCWYKLKPRLESAGHRVTALDMAAAGTHMGPIGGLRTFADYNEPLMRFMRSLPVEETVVLVGHSLGAINVAFAVEEFPMKVSAAVFLSLMPDTLHKPSYFLEEIFKKTTDENGWLDCQFSTYGNPDEPLIGLSLGHEFLSVCYTNSPREDLELAKALVRPVPDFSGDLAKAKNFSDQGYGSVRRVFVLTNEDRAMPEEFQRRMVESSGLKEVKEIAGADHMAMLSKPQELCDCLLEIAESII